MGNLRLQHLQPTSHENCKIRASFFFGKNKSHALKTLIRKVNVLIRYKAKARLLRGFWTPFAVYLQPAFILEIEKHSPDRVSGRQGFFLFRIQSFLP